MKSSKKPEVSRNSPKVIVGIDPGTVAMGYGIIQAQGTHIKILAIEELILDKALPIAVKLKKIYDKTQQVLQGYQPEEVALESPFLGKNTQALLKISQAQSIAIAAALNQGLPFTEYAPKKIKKAITGRGNASKEQVSLMLQKLLKFQKSTQTLDATDGLAIAVCHAFCLNQSPSTLGKPLYRDWEAYIAENTDKIQSK